MKMQTWKGVPCASGIALAQAAVLCEAAADTATKTLEEAVKACVREVRSLHQKALEEAGEKSAEIFSAYEMLLSDKYMLAPIAEQQAGGMELPRAVETALERRAAVFARAKSEYMRQRAEDIRNIKKMLLQELCGAAQCKLPTGGSSVVLFAQTLSPADTMRIEKTRLAGLVTQYGGATSHIVILAKALGIPAITGFAHLGEIQDGAPVLIDGDTGGVVQHPDAAQQAAASQKVRTQAAFTAQLKNLPKGETATRDGQQVHISLNIGTSADVNGVDFDSVHGVGLYRTEFLYTECIQAPTVLQQVQEYEKIFAAMKGKEIVVRTLDIGGDKKVPYLQLPQEENPFLGCRGIRLCLRHEVLLRDQFEALLRAARGAAFSVMFPMVNTVAEYKSAKQIWNETCAQMAAHDIAVNSNIRLGIMVETPAAVLCADMLAQCVDFASIGTNDLTQYLLAADRGNPETGVALSHYAPAVLRAVSHVIATFAKAGKKVSVCGEAGADTAFLPMLLAMGLRNVSVSPASVALVRHCVFRTSCEQWKPLLKTVLHMEDEVEIRALAAQQFAAYQPEKEESK